MSLNLLKEQLEQSQIIKKRDYRYIINPITEQEPALRSDILIDCADRLLKKLNYKHATKILTPEAMGIPIATVVSLKTSIPLIIATKRKKRVLREIAVEYASGYEKGILHINNIKKGDKILIIDDLISTGGTIIALIEGIKKLGAEVTDIGAIFNKKDYQGIKKLEELGFQPKTLLTIKLKETKIEVEDC